MDAGLCKPPPISIPLHRYTFDYTNPDNAQNPVVYVTWDMAKNFCEWRVARLPTEAEWEKAARGEDGRTYPWGEDIDCTKANYAHDNLVSCGGGISEVGSYENGISPYGAYDMAGNAREWVADWYSETFYHESPLSDPVGPSSGETRVVRDGPFFFSENFIRTSNRSGSRLNYSNSIIIGIRCAKDASP